MLDRFPSFDELRALPTPPRLHPNGFVTLDLDRERKFHLWPETPIRARSDGGASHDHVFAFVSRVLMGYLVDTRYELAPDPLGKYELYQTACQGGRCHTSPSGLERVDALRYDLRQTVRRIVRAGETYDFPVQTLHQSQAIGLTATLMRITDFGAAENARVLIPAGKVPEAFDRTLSERELHLVWDEIARVCRRIA